MHKIIITGTGQIITFINKKGNLDDAKNIARALWQTMATPITTTITDEEGIVVFEHIKRR